MTTTELNKNPEDTLLLKHIIRAIQIYESDCMKKNEQSSSTKVKTIIEEMCREN